MNKHIYSCNGGYKISKRINGVNEHFGLYKSLEEARIARDYFKNHDWDKSLKKKSWSNPRHIQRISNGKFIISKHFNDGHTQHYGTYSSLKVAEEMRDYLIRNDWVDVEGRLNLRKYGKRNLPKYINKINGRYQIYKYLNGKNETFGSFKTLEEAVHERDLLIKNGWDWELICEEV